jgi:hypothetical protein
MRLLLERGGVAAAGPLNLQRKEKLLTVLVTLAALATVAGLASGAPVLAGTAPLVAVGAILAGNAPMLRWFARVRGLAFAAAVVPMRVSYYLLNAAAAAWAIAGHLRRAPRVTPLAGATPPVSRSRSW